MRKTAIILSGGVCRGAFESGSLKVLIQNPELNVKTIVATSSGAINSLALTAGIASGNVDFAIDDLMSVWIEQGSWRDILHFSLKNLWEWKGVSTSKSLYKTVKSNVEKILTTNKNPVELKIILTQLSGRTSFIAGKPNTTFEGVIGFNNNDFFDEEKRKLIYTAACASSAFPGLFVPVFVPGYDWCVDGGLTNNAAIKVALQEDIDRIIILSPFPFISASHDDYGGLNLVGRIGDIIVNERLYRDLVEAEKINAIVRKISALKEAKELSPELYTKIDNILHNKKEVEIIQVRPKHKLKGNSFSGLFNKDLRKYYVDEGIKAALNIKL